MSFASTEAGAYSRNRHIRLSSTGCESKNDAIKIYSSQSSKADILFKEAIGNIGFLRTRFICFVLEYGVTRLVQEPRLVPDSSG